MYKVFRGEEEAEHEFGEAAKEQAGADCTNHKDEDSSKFNYLIQLNS